MKRFLVTGGAGFIGSHIVCTLVKAGHYVRVLDNFSSGKARNLEDVSKEIAFIKADIRHYDSCVKATKNIDFVLHHAALRSVPKSLNNPKEYNEVNVAGTLNLLEASRKNNVKLFVLASSSSVYGDINNFPQKEAFRPEPISPYALTKLVGEHYCKIFSRHYGLSTVSLRYFNVFGPRQSLDDEYAVVVPRFIACALKGEPMPIYGSGRQSRDFTYVDNVVRANILAVRNAGLRGDVFNVASGHDYTVLELARMLNRITGKNIKPKFLDLRPGDVFRTLADLSKSKSILGFYPKIDFLKGLKLTVDYFKNNA